MKKPKINDVVYLKDNAGKYHKATVCDTWEADQYHQGGFRAYETKKYGNMDPVEFHDDELGINVFLELPK